MFHSSSRCSPWLALAFAACATTQATSPAVSGGSGDVEPPPPPRPVVPLSASTIELRDVNLGLNAGLSRSLELVGGRVPAWASDQKHVWPLGSTAAGHGAPAFELPDNLWEVTAIVSTGARAWAVAAGLTVSFFEGERPLRSCDQHGTVEFLAPAAKGGVIAFIAPHQGTPSLVALDAQCLRRWTNESVKHVVHATTDWVYALTPEGTLTRLAVADGSAGGALKLSGRVISSEHVAGDTLYLVTQEGDGKGTGTSPTFLERVELSAWRTTARPLGAQPSDPWPDYEVQAGEQGVVVVVTPTKAPVTLFALSSAGQRTLTIPGERSAGWSGSITQVGPRWVVAAQSRLHFFDAAQGRLESSVDLGRAISRVATVDGELNAVTEGALFRLRGTAAPPRAASNVAWLRARPFQPGGVAALTDGSPSTGFEFVDKAIVELIFTKPVVLRGLSIAARHDRPEIEASVTSLELCAREAGSACSHARTPEQGAPLLSAPTLTHGVVLELGCRVPSGVPADVNRRCRITELQFE